MFQMHIEATESRMIACSNPTRRCADAASRGDRLYSVFFWIAAWPEWPGKISIVLMFTISSRP